MNQTEELQPEVLDVTIIEPRLKHPTIFAHFDKLLPGTAMIIHNDHDPKPLYYQLLGERGNCFTWNYLLNGPAIWEVEIRRNDAEGQAQTMGEIVAKDLRKAEVLKKFGLDFCCGGKKNLGGSLPGKRPRCFSCPGGTRKTTDCGCRCAA